jgi:hypothetical protein
MQSVESWKRDVEARLRALQEIVTMFEKMKFRLGVTLLAGSMAGRYHLTAAPYQAKVYKGFFN